MSGLQRTCLNIGTLLPCTSRAKRSNGDSEYHYVSEAEFCHMISDEQFLFWHYDGDDVKGNAKYYGLTRDEVESGLGQYDHVLFSIGRSVAARFFKSRFPFSKTIDLYPESTEQLQRQVASRSGEAPQELQRRLSLFRKSENEHLSSFDTFILNVSGQVENAIEAVANLIGVSDVE